MKFLRDFVGTAVVGGLIVLAMNVRPRGLLDAGAMLALKRLMVASKDRTGA